MGVKVATWEEPYDTCIVDPVGRTVIGKGVRTNIPYVSDRRRERWSDLTLQGCVPRVHRGQAIVEGASPATNLVR